MKMDKWIQGIFWLWYHSVNRLTVRTKGEDRIMSNSGILSATTGWISHINTGKTGGMV